MAVQLVIDVTSAESHRSIFEKLESYQEIFGEEKCGKCGGENIQYKTRDAEDKKGKVHRYYELVCRSCWAKKRFGCKNDGGNSLFPRRKAGESDASGLAEGEWLPDNGWLKFNKETGKEE